MKPGERATTEQTGGGGDVGEGGRQRRPLSTSLPGATGLQPTPSPAPGHPGIWDLGLSGALPTWPVSLSVRIRASCRLAVASHLARPGQRPFLISGANSPSHAGDRKLCLPQSEDRPSEAQAGRGACG